MLDLHRTQAAATVDVDLNGIIEKVLALTGRQLRSGGVEIVRRLADDLSLIQGAPQDLQQVILNLVLNASEAMPGGGTLTVSSQNEDEHAVISVRDTGAGITEENQRRIFEPFFSARVTGGGVGLGLYLARNTVEIHQGTISVESSPGKGSTFTLRFPKR